MEGLVNDIEILFRDVVHDIQRLKQEGRVLTKPTRSRKRKGIFKIVVHQYSSEIEKGLNYIKQRVWDGKYIVHTVTNDSEIVLKVTIDSETVLLIVP